MQPVMGQATGLSGNASAPDNVNESKMTYQVDTFHRVNVITPPIGVGDNIKPRVRVKGCRIFIKAVRSGWFIPSSQLNGMVMYGRKDDDPVIRYCPECGKRILVSIEAWEEE